MADNNFVPMVFLNENKAVTSSRAVAEMFGKRHDHILRDIESLINTLEETTEGKAFSHSNFGLAERPDLQGKPRPIYLMTRDGFTLLAMGFTGAKAIQFKVAYINAFNRMESIIRYGASPERVHQLEHTTKELEAVNPTPNSFLLEAGLTIETETQDNISELAKAEETATVFITAIMEALKSGKYYLKEKGKRGDQENCKTFLGIYDETTLMLISSVAYKIYADFVGIKYNVLSISQLLSKPLLYSGLMFKRTKGDSRRKLMGKYCCVTRISLSKAEELYSKTKALVSAQGLGQADTKAHIKPTE